MNIIRKLSDDRQLTEQEVNWLQYFAEKAAAHRCYAELAVNFNNTGHQCDFAACIRHINEENDERLKQAIALMTCLAYTGCKSSDYFGNKWIEQMIVHWNLIRPRQFVPRPDTIIP